MMPPGRLFLVALGVFGLTVSGLGKAVRSESLLDFLLPVFGRLDATNPKP